MGPGHAVLGVAGGVHDLYAVLPLPQGEDPAGFGLHCFLASNTISNQYYPELAGILFRLRTGGLSPAPPGWSSRPRSPPP